MSIPKIVYSCSRWRFAAALLVLLPLLSFVPPRAVAQGEGPQEAAVIQDMNGDGVVTVLAIGDSITYGIGDGFEAGQSLPELPPQDSGPGGYPMRVAALTGLVTENAGVPGDILTVGMVARLPEEVRTSNADIVLLLGGANDALFLTTRGSVERALQRMVNVTRALGRQVVVGAPPPPCCRRVALAPFVREYAAAARAVAFMNNVPVFDLERAWRTTCEDAEACELYNVPEGLHPNALGYDVIAQVVTATLFGIDLFAPEGASLLEQALGLPEGAVVVRPG